MSDPYSDSYPPWLWEKEPSASPPPPVAEAEGIPEAPKKPTPRKKVAR